MKVVNIDIDNIKPYSKNPRINDNAVDYVAKSIKEFGFKVPIVIDKNNVIVAGHTRYKASKQLGLKEVPCIVAGDLTEEQIKAFRLADNKVSEFADWDIDLLNNELDDITNIDMSDFGFESFGEDEDVQEDCFEEELPQEAKTKRGDVYKLGNHYLMCGDSTNENDVKKLMSGKFSDLCFCDPPYDFDNDTWIDNLKYNKEGYPVLLMSSDKQVARLVNKIPNFRQFIIHDREQAVMISTSTPMSQHTIISLFCDHPSNYFVNCNDHFTTIIKCRKDYKKAEDEMNSKMGKPLEVISQLLKHYSRKGDIVLDLFGGGGSVLVTCEQIDRTCYTMELDEFQCDLIVKRFEEFTGEKAKLI